MLETKCQENARAIAQQIKAGASSASAVTYDNTSSGLTADDVQEAIDELASAGHTYSTTPKKIGKWTDGKDIYEVVMHLESPYEPKATGTAFPSAVETVLESADTIISVHGIGNGACVSIGIDTESNTIKGYTFSDWSLTDLILTYTVAPTP